MYQNVRTCIKQGEDISGFFRSNVGVKQGESLSPFLFSIFLNDLEQFFAEQNAGSLEKITNICEESLSMYIKLFVILYADDTVLLSESAEGLQETLTIFEQYCNIWKLKVNIKKTQVVIFCKRKSRQSPIFMINNQPIDVKDSYTYLGIIFNYNGSFCNARKKLIEQAQKSLYALYRKIKNLNIPIDLQLKLFDSLVVPILLYGCEIWGFENKEIIEKIHLQFCKRILRVRNSTPNFMVYGELGRYPIEIIIKQRMLMYWNSLLTNSSKLSSIMYNLMLKLYNSNPTKFRWISFIKSTLDHCGLSFIWHDQIPFDKTLLKSTVKQKLVDQFIQNWFSLVNNSSRGKFYSIFKNEFCLESYLIKLNQNNRLYISKLRCCNIKFPIETGRWTGIPVEDRICRLCRTNLGDEFHYLFNCKDSKVTEFRQKYIPSYYLKNPSEIKLKGMLSICHIQLYKNLSLFLKNICCLL